MIMKTLFQILQWVQHNQPLIAFTLVWLLATLLAYRHAARSHFAKGWDAALLAVAKKLHTNARNQIRL